MRLAGLFVLPCVLSAQLIPAGQPVPKSPSPPVVFLNGYQSTCSGSDFASNFAAADKLLQANSLVTLYFDNCTVTGAGGAKPDIEAEGIAFGKFLAALKYTDGTPVTQVDIVAHSMGGLIVRSYLAGMQDVTPAVFTPPVNPVIRRMIFLSTPHFGTALAALLGVDIQTQEMAPASAFLLALNTWNQGGDDLRGLSAISVSGNGGTGLETSIPGYDDGVVAVSSSSLGFYQTGRTRLVPDCHTTNTLLVIAGFCSSSTPALNMITNDTSNPVSQIIVSFLTGTTAWQSIGTAVESNPLVSVLGGINVQLRDQADNPLSISSASYSAGSMPTSLKLNSNAAGYLEAMPSATPVQLQVSPVSGTAQTATVTVPPTTILEAVVKPGPLINPKGVICAAGPAPFPYDVAAGAYVSIYGSNLAGSSSAATQPYPTQIGDVQVLVNGVAQPLQYVSSGQINFIYANASPGLTQVTVKNANGQNTVNVRVALAVPSIFLLDSASTAAAVDVTTLTVASASAPFHAGDIMSLYATGLGATTRMNGLDYAQIVPTVSVGGQNCAVSYAGRSPSFAGLDQINCTIPAGVTGASVPVVITSNGRASNSAFIPVH